jgi:hypothetical protein
VRQLIGTAIEFAISEPLVVEYDGDGVGRSLDLFFKQSMDALICA